MDNFKNGIASRGIPLPSASDLLTLGNVYYVNSAASLSSDDNDGDDPSLPLATLDKAIGKCTADQKDIILIAPAHAETVTSVITVDIAGISIIGIGNGKNRPAFTQYLAADGITVTADDVVIKNLYFPASTLTGCTSRINVAASNLTIEDCLFICGEYDTETITVTATGIDLVIKGNEFICDSASEADAAIEIESASADGLKIIGNYFDGYDDTQAWDTGAVNSAVANTRCLIKDNISLYGPAIILSSTATGMIIGNTMGEGTLGSMLDPGSCMCSNNKEADAVDQYGREFPASPAS